MYAPAERTDENDMTPARRTVTLLLVAASAVALGVGLTGPCMTVVPHAGELEGWVRLLKPEALRPSAYSVVGGIAALWSHGNAPLGALLFGFSVLFPAAKLAVMAWAAAHESDAARHGPASRVAHHAGKFSMLDVLVVGVLVVAVKGLPGGTEVHVGWGLYLFAASVILALLAGVALHGAREKEHATKPASTPA